MLPTIVRSVVVLVVLCLVAAVRPVPREIARDDVSKIDGAKAKLDATPRRGPEARDPRSLRDGRALRDGRLYDATAVEPQPFTFHRRATIAETSTDPRGLVLAFSVARSARGPPV